MENYNKFSLSFSLFYWYSTAKWAIIKERLCKIRHPEIPPRLSMQNNARASTTVASIALGLRWELKKKKQNLKRKREMQARKRQHAASRLRFRFNCDYSEASPWPAWRTRDATRRDAPSRTERSALAVSHRAGGCCNKSSHRSASEARAIKKGKIWIHHGTHSAERGEPFFFFLRRPLPSEVHSAAFVPFPLFCSNAFTFA